MLQVLLLHQLEFLWVNLEVMLQFNQVMFLFKMIV